jgi:hypothetical protein
MTFSFFNLRLPNYTVLFPPILHRSSLSPPHCISLPSLYQHLKEASLDAENVMDANNTFDSDLIHAIFKHIWARRFRGTHPCFLRVTYSLYVDLICELFYSIAMQKGRGAMPLMLRKLRYSIESKTARINWNYHLVS